MYCYHTHRRVPVLSKYLEPTNLYLTHIARVALGLVKGIGLLCLKMRELLASLLRSIVNYPVYLG